LKWIFAHLKAADAHVEISINLDVGITYANAYRGERSV
jgi:hypothetical protein